MDDAEKIATRHEILGDVSTILREELAGDSWGRVLVEVIRARDGSPVVAGIDVEEIFKDESRVDDAFAGETARAVVPVLAKAVEALCALDEVALEDVRGGTFVNLGDGRFGWLAALVHAPSARLDRERETLTKSLRTKNDALASEFGFPSRGRLDFDLMTEVIVFSSASGAHLGGQATLIGTFAPGSRTWGWGGSNPHVPEAVRRTSATLVDSVVDRDMWELSTPVFATDESTAWALAAFICDRAGGSGVFCAPESDGLVFVLVRDIRLLAVPSSP